ncbi:hypothetical protein [Candidatus Liberibacter sp.]|uniref:hypothetical protein n=1 Tax=Candidatus Liberibacter sp. TaxID=34022 RepID=UPI0015F65C7E|nr:hypothetical protein [Candidatus Liberibacter sp.]MBA5724350.1 hypothetical protein [Candidatus Liberibacter sp.]
MNRKIIALILVNIVFNSASITGVMAETRDNKYTTQNPIKVAVGKEHRIITYPMPNFLNIRLLALSDDDMELLDEVQSNPKVMAALSKIFEEQQKIIVSKNKT